MRFVARRAMIFSPASDFGCRDGGDLGADEREDERDDADQGRGPAFRREAAIIDQVADRGRAGGIPAEGVGGGDQDEDEDGRDLDGGEPEFEFAIGARGQQVGAGQQHGEDECDDPGRRFAGQVMACDFRAHERLERHDDDPEIPVDPAEAETGEIAHGEARILCAGADAVARRRHFGERAHDE